MREVTRSRPQVQLRLTRQGTLYTLGLLIVFSLIALPQYLRAKKSAQWPSVPGVITESYMRSGLCKGMPCFHGEIAYRYRVGGMDYQGTQLDMGRSHWAAREPWQQELDQYPVGKSVMVYYEPGHPATAVLEPGLHGEMKLLYKMDLFFIGVFSLGLVVVLLRYRDDEDVVSFAKPTARFD